MRKALLLLAVTALIASCGAGPVAPEDSGALHPAEECNTQNGNPC
ncbi:MAG: hypothetical protein R3326_03720 [Gemmatimonadota bacterium]|nr:hypothetical protein [Gemmatimonadota bacterium]